MKTPLYNHHCALGAKIVEFCGWEMPISYQGIIQEHRAVREKAGIFDVSHMGRIVIHGRDAERFLDYLSTNAIAGKSNLTATYTVWCSASGVCVDDVIVYKQDADHFFVIVNAGNRQKDLEHLLSHRQGYDVQIEDCYADEGILSIQGPFAGAIVCKLFPEAQQVKPMHFIEINCMGKQIILSRTGYTGSGGFEVYAPHAVIIALWERFLAEGAMFGLVPVGLGARDTLRLEMGYALYGHELSEEIAASETVSAWTIKWNQPDFLGKAALLALEKNVEKRSEYGIILLEPGIARAGYIVLYNGQEIGYVTSGTLSPTLNKAVAIILVNCKLEAGELVEVQIRQKNVKAEVVELPFVHIEKG